jgi:pimeloyl-ACP methyl ester carboxylesterase
MERQASQMLGSGIRLLCVERGGVGESDPNPDPSAEAYADDVGVLLDALGIDRFAVIGRSMGSWDALALALKRHSQVSQVALISGRLPVARAADHERHAHFARSLYRSIWNSSVVGNLMLRVMRLQLLTSGPQRFFDLNSMPAREAELAADPRFLKHARAIWLRSAVHGAGPVQAHLKLYQDPVSDPPWRDFALPVLLVHGDCDDTGPLDSVLAQTASFRNRRVVVMPGLGHALVHLAMPEVLQLVRDGLTENAADC